MATVKILNEILGFFFYAPQLRLSINSFRQKAREICIMTSQHITNLESTSLIHLLFSVPRYPGLTFCLITQYFEIPQGLNDVRSKV